jgi:hypothetical protein
MKFHDPKYLQSLYNEAVDHRNERLRSFKERVKRLVGPAYDGEAVFTDDYVNHAYAFLSVMTPRASSGIPKVKCATTKEGMFADIAKAHEFYGSKWARNNLSSKFRARMFQDYSMFWAVALVWFETANDDPRNPERQTIRPKVSRIRMDRFFIDAACEDPTEARFMGHVWVMDRAKLLERAESEEGWDVEKIRNIAPDRGIANLDDGTSERRTVERDDVVGIDWYFPDWEVDPELGPSDGFNGTVATTLLDGENGCDFIREPRPYFGPAGGGYCYHGYMSVPQSPWYLSPLTATAPMELALAEAQKIVNLAVRQYKRVVLVPAGTLENPGAGAAAKRVAFAPDSCIIEVPGMPAESTPVVVEIGGVTDQMLRNLSLMRDQLQTHAGLDAAQVGDVVGAGTATEHSIANAGAQTRMGGIMDGFRALQNEIVRKVLWFAYYTQDVVAQLGPDAAESYNMENPFFDSGAFEPEELGSFENVIDAEIEVLSIERTTEPVHQARIQSIVETVMAMAPAARQFPEWDWKRLLSIVGDTVSLPTMGNLWNQEMSLLLMGMDQAMARDGSGQGMTLRLGSDHGQEPTPISGAGGVQTGINRTGRSAGATAASSSGAAQRGRAVTPRSGRPREQLAARRQQ